jgi:ATP-dependent helicase HrpB
MLPLPIDPLLHEAIEALRAHRALVLEAEPGAGKTTRFPWAAMEAGLAGKGEVVVLEPRRLAARMAARRIASERGLRLGDEVGYQVRFEEVVSPRTRLRMVTEGILTRRLLAEPSLPGVGMVILDEFHERHLQGDLALALLRRLQETRRPDLKLAIMSATLDAGPLKAWLGDCPSLLARGRRFEVAVEYLEKPDPRPLDAQVAGAVKRLLANGTLGDILVFLPGAREIRQARDACQGIASSLDLAVLPLHGELSPEEQDLAVGPNKRRKVILSTNVAESSVTIDGVTAVVDTGLVRIAGYSPWSGLPSLKVVRVSKSSAIQRAGRAGRTRPGQCLRLYTRHDFETRPEHEASEIARMDLAEVQLALHGMGLGNHGQLAWFEPPPSSSLEAAEELLRRLGSIDRQGALTPLGRQMVGIPAHPRQARVLVEARSRGVGRTGAVIAAILGEGDFRRSEIMSGRASQAAVSAPSDLLELADLFEQARRSDFNPGKLRSLGLHEGAVRSVDRSRKQLESHRGADAASPSKDPEQALLMSILAGYPDRVARRRSLEKVAPGAGASELLLSAGGTARLSDSSVVRDAPFLVAVDAEERGARPGMPRAGAIISLASAIEPDWLLDLFGEEVRPESELHWNPQLERVEGVSRLKYGALVLEESRDTSVDPAAASRLLATVALERGLAAFAPEGAWEALLGRLRFIEGAAPGSGLAAPDAEAQRALLEQLCEGHSSLAELRSASLVDLARAQMGAKAAEFDSLAPESLRLPGGRSVAIHYEPGKPPWAESHLQDFFGMVAGPSIARGRVPVVLHLLAPNRRAVQVTTDLAGFWERHYPAIRKELSRRYPRHSWPDDPRTATPPAPRRR